MAQADILDLLFAAKTLRLIFSPEAMGWPRDMERIGTRRCSVPSSDIFETASMIGRTVGYMGETHTEQSMSQAAAGRPCIDSSFIIRI